jgi:hypothetical protein
MNSMRRGEQPITRAQYENIAAVLRADPPEITGTLAEQKADGSYCNCALGKLAKAVGISDAELENVGYDALIKNAEFHARYGLIDRYSRQEDGPDGLHVVYVYGPNDDVKSGTPAERAENVIAALSERVAPEA